MVDLLRGNSMPPCIGDSLSKSPLFPRLLLRLVLPIGCSVDGVKSTGNFVQDSLEARHTEQTEEKPTLTTNIKHNTETEQPNTFIQRSKFKLFMEGIKSPTISTLSLSRLLFYWGIFLSLIGLAWFYILSRSFLFAALFFCIAGVNGVAIISETRSYKNLRNIEKELEGN